MVLLRVEGQSTSVYNIKQYNKCYITFLGDTDWQSVGAPVGADIGTTFTSNTSNVTGTGQVVIIHGSQNEIPSYYLDLGDVSMKADYSILEIQDITQRKSENTQAFTLPFTETNNDFFSHFYNVNATGDFDVNVKTNASVSVDSNEVIDGYLQLLSVNTTTQTYEVVVYGVIANIVNQLSDNKLNELDLSAYNHVLNIDNVTDSWDGAITYTDASTGDEILYPIIDYGYGYDEDNIEITYNKPVLTCDRLKPAIKVFTVLKEILKKAGYPSIDSSFLNSDFFYNQYMTLGDSSEFLNNDLEDSFRIGKLYPQTFNYNTPADIVFDRQTSGTGFPFHTGEGNLNSSGFYTAPSDGFYRFRFKINYTTTSLAFYGFIIHPVINSVVQEKRYRANIGLTTGTNWYFTLETDLIYLNSGDVLKFQGEFGLNTTPGNSLTILASSTDEARQTTLELIESPASSVGSTIKFDSGNNIMPKVTQIEFLKSILSRYNLVMQRSILFPGQIIIEPIQDFLDVGASIDWTDKLDTSKPVIIKPTYEFQKDKVIFKDQEGEDQPTVDYEKKFGHPYNFYSIEIQSDFKQKGNNLEIESIFSSFTNDWIGGGIDMLMPRLYQINNNEIERIDAKPKLFYYSGKKTCNNFELYESSGSASGTVLYEYPFCSHYSMIGDTIQDTDFDIRFKSGGSIGESKGGLVHKQTKTDTFTRCWSEYLHNIFDKDARILIADFKLSAVDIARFKYNDKIFVKDTYYRVNKIANYAIGKDITTRVELIKVLNFENTLAIGGCGLRVGAIQYDGTVLFTESDGSASTGNKVCCEKNGYEWIGRDIQKCKQIIDSRVNTKPPTAERNRITQESRLGTDRKDTKVKGRVTELSDSDNATNGQLLSWNTTDGNTEWVDAPSSGSPGTPLNSVQFNYNGAFTGDSDFSFNQFSNILDVSTIRAENTAAGIYLSGGFQYIFLSPVDFIATASSSSNGFISNDGARLGIISGQTYYAQFQVPKGYKANYINLRGSTGYTFFVYASSYSSGTQVYKATGTINTPLTLLSYQQLIGAAGDYFTIKVTPSGYGNYIYGCQIGLIKT